jgi:hypothetical protein
MRDNNVHFVRAFVMKFDGTSNITEAEAMGVLEVLQWNHNTHYGVVQIKTHCLQVVQRLDSKRMNDTEFVNIIDE